MLDQRNWIASVFVAALLSAVIYALLFAEYINGRQTGYWPFVVAAILCGSMPLVGWLGYSAMQSSTLRSAAVGFALAPFPGALIILEIWALR
ncbi:MULTISPECIES: hypothetical protein [unclassified Mycolicibacterium]|uniref:hypothetical protein n=1 Tax=unclassified Mycolicibacterium TaxID=2636767 RepID=UPI002EDA7C30